MTTLSRRAFLRSLLTVPAVLTLPGTALRAALVPAGLPARNLVVVDLVGGNDGLNTIVPYGVSGGTYASEFRPTLAVPTGSLHLIDAELGFHPSLASLASHYTAGRLALCLGVGSPTPSFSHDVATKVWMSGDPGVAASGWLGRHLATLGAQSFPPSATIADDNSLLLAGSGAFSPAFASLGAFSFPYDYAHYVDGVHRRAAYQAIAQGLAAQPGDVGQMANTSLGMLELIDVIEAIDPFAHVGVYPQGSSLAPSLQAVAQLLSADIGMRIFHVPYGGWDTHGDQEGSDLYHTTRLAKLDGCLAAFQDDLSALGIASDTLVLVVTEFGRTVYENGSGGTDHGTVGPVLVLGEGVSGGVITEHPSLDPADLDGNGELPLTTDFRDVLATVLEHWLQGDPGVVFPGHAYTDLGFLT